MGERPDDGDIGAMVWPVVRAFLDSEHTLTSLAEAAGVKPREIERAILKPGATTPGIWARMMFAMNREVRLTVDLYEPAQAWPRMLRRTSSLMIPRR